MSACARHMMEIKPVRFAAVAVSTTTGKRSSPPSVPGQGDHPNMDMETVNKILTSRLGWAKHGNDFFGNWHVTREWQVSLKDIGWLSSWPCPTCYTPRRLCLVDTMLNCCWSAHLRTNLMIQVVNQSLRDHEWVFDFSTIGWQLESLNSIVRLYLKGCL